MRNLKIVSVVTLVAAIVLFAPKARATSVDTWPKPNLHVTGNLTVDGAISPPPTFYSTQTVTAAQLTSTYGVNGATATISGAATVGTTLSVGTTLTVTAGAIKPYKRSIAQLMAITPAVGDIYSCTDCTLTYDLVVGTGATAGGFRESGTNHGPQ